MKKEFRFFARNGIYYGLLITVLTLVLIAGVLIFHSGNNLFGTYTKMYVIFLLLFPFCFALSEATYRNVALAFGAKRTACFWAVELIYGLLSVLFLALARLVEWAAQFVPDLSDHVLHVGPAQAVLLLLVCLLVVQIGFLLGGITDGKHRALATALLVILVMAIVCGAGLALAFGVANALPEGDSLYRLSLTSPLWLGIFAALAVGTLILGWLVYRQHERAVVSA